MIEIIEILGNVEPPNIEKDQIGQFSVGLTFSKIYENLVRKNFPQIPEVKVYVLAQRISEFQDQENFWFKTQLSEKNGGDFYEWKISSLRPFTRYHFKVVFEISRDLKFETQPSLKVRTKAGGKPSKPLFLKVEQVNTAF